MNTPSRRSIGRNHAKPSDRNTKRLKCSVCGNSFQIDQATHPPFCSERCKMVDLGRWMNEEIGMPHEGGPSQGEASDFGGDFGEDDT